MKKLKLFACLVSVTILFSACFSDDKTDLQTNYDIENNDNIVVESVTEEDVSSNALLISDESEISHNDAVNTNNSENDERYRYYTKDEKLEKINSVIDSKLSGNDAETKILLDELGEMDSDEKIALANILDYWDEVNAPDYTNVYHVPDNLPDDNSLVIIVLGFCLKPDGSMKDELKGRLLKAVSIAREYPDAYILVTGGGTASKNKDATEADVMAEFLISKGINSEQIIIENRSQTTVENAIFSSEIICDKYPEITKAVMVTSDYHVPFGAVLFETAFQTNVSMGKNEVNVIANYGYLAHSADYFSVENQGRSIYSVMGRIINE